jgi:hypothetical protein
LWEEQDLAPTSLWLGSSGTVVGSREPQVIDRQGLTVTALSAATPPFRMEASGDEARLLVADRNGLKVWETATWTPIAAWKGPWLDASIDPSGRYVAAVDVYGGLKLSALSDRLTPIAITEAPDPLSGVALGADRIVAAFARGAPVRQASFSGSDP